MYTVRSQIGQPVVLDFGSRDVRFSPFEEGELSSEELESEEFKKYEHLFEVVIPTHKTAKQVTLEDEEVQEGVSEMTKKETGRKVK